MPLMSNMELRGRKIGEEIGELRGIERGRDIGKEIGKEIGALENARNYIKTVLKKRMAENPIYKDQALDKNSVLSILDYLLKTALTVNTNNQMKQLI
ncbi:MAG: hypothetical protein ACKPGT_06830, partial [Microcystis sp.]